jgi:hypothetical protein
MTLWRVAEEKQVAVDPNYMYVYTLQALSNRATCLGPGVYATMDTIFLQFDDYSFVPILFYGALWYSKENYILCKRRL